MICALDHVELRHLISDAPRYWQELGSPFDRRGIGIVARRFWQTEAKQTMGCAVTLECGDADEVWCVPLHQDRTIRSNNHDTR